MSRIQSQSILRFLLVTSVTCLYAMPLLAQEAPPAADGMTDRLAPDGQPMPMSGFGDSTPVNIGVLIRDGAYVAENSSLAEAVAGKVTATQASGLRIKSAQARFNALYVSGAASDFTLSDSILRLTGTGGDDASGIGSAVLVGDGGTLTLKHVKIVTSAPVASAAVATTHGTLRVYNSKLITHGGALPPDYKPHIGPGMMEAPPPLGITGTARAVNTTVGASSYYYDTKIISDGWGALSTDAGGKYVECNRCFLKTIHSGYGTYSDSGIAVVVKDSKIRSATFVSIIAGTGKLALNNVNATSGTHGIMIHSVMGRSAEIGTLVIKGGVIATQDSSIWVKSANADISADGTAFEPANGIILETIINSDPNATKAKPDSPGTFATFRNCTLNGSILGDDTQRKLSVTLASSRLTGAVHKARLTMEAGARWMVTANSDLILLKGAVSQIDAPVGVTVLAVATPQTLAAGDYRLAGGGILTVSN
jgi:hypothetical protein